MAHRFYFAWVDSTDTTFIDAFKRNDEAVFSFALSQSEGDFATLDVEIVNPRVGMLGPGRKQWAWFAYNDGATTHPLFFGRIVGVPQALEENVISIALVAKPLDYAAQKADLAASMRVSPYYEPMWLSDADAANPDTVLEGYTKLWHIDRVTHVLTASDILNGEDTQMDFVEGDAYYDSVQVSPNGQPVQRIDVTAAVTWAQTGAGEMDLTSMLVKRFNQISYPPTGIFGDSFSSTGNIIQVVAGDNMMSSWPKPGNNIGGGWTVGTETYAVLAGPVPLPPTIVSGPDYAKLRQGFLDPLTGSPIDPFVNVRNAESIRQMLGRSPGFVANIVDHTTNLQQVVWGVGSGEIDVLWIPVWTVGVRFVVAWNASRDRTENLSFSITADVQPLLADADGADVVALSLGSVACDNYITDRRSTMFFSTARGVHTMENLIARARAVLLSAARAVDVSFDVPFDLGIQVSLRKSATLFDPRLPGGVVGGKIKQYTLALNGDDGAIKSSVTIGCSVGRGGHIDLIAGTPSYVAEGYVNAGYQYYTGSNVLPTGGDVGYQGGFDYVPDNDGVSLFSVQAGRYVTLMDVSGGTTAQAAAVDPSNPPNDTGAAALDVINGFATNIKIQLKPVTGGPFTTDVELTLSPLKVPKTIDLEFGDEETSA